MTETSAKLDENFDSLLLQMKPYVMSMIDRSERQRCASWIKKLCQFSEASSWEKKTRNTYAQLLFHLLKRGSLDNGVFSVNPPDGPLEQLSASTMQSHSEIPNNGLVLKCMFLKIPVRYRISKTLLSGRWLLKDD